MWNVLIFLIGCSWVFVGVCFPPLLISVAFKALFIRFECMK